MSRKSPGQRPGFFRQGVLILLPTALLLLLGYRSLRSDQEAAEQDARDRAAQAIQYLNLQADLWWNSLTNLDSTAVHLGKPTDVIRFQVDAAGQLVRPQPRRALTPAPEDFQQLTATQHVRWQAALAAEASGDSARAVAAWQSVLEVDSLQQIWVARARLSLGHWLEQQKHFEPALQQWVFVITNSPGLIGETGLPVGQLAAIRALKIWPQIQSDFAVSQSAGWHAQAGTQARIQPTLLSRDILTALDELQIGTGTIVPTWLGLWDLDETGRSLYEQWRHVTANNELTSGLHWLDETNWLYGSIALPWKGAARTEIICCRPETAKAEWSNLLAPAGRLGWPFVTQAEVAGRPAYVDYPMELPNLGQAPILASGANDATGFHWRVHLVNREMLYARFRNRRLMTTGLMLAAAATAIFGFFSARKAYWQQTQLAESKSNFVAAVSHELRAPIASIQLLVESLERGTVPTEERRQEYFRLISQECRRLGGLIRNVLDFSRIEQGAKSYARELVDVAALLEHTRAVLAPMAASRAVTLKVIWPEKPLTVWGDGQALQQALLNLIDNALKHSPADSTVTVDVTQMDEAWVEFSVRDEGPGIPLAEQQRIFEPFYRLGSELRRETEGAGIGLAIVRHIMAGHGGTVTVHSEPGNGSRFVLRLPSGEANSSEGAKS